MTIKQQVTSADIDKMTLDDLQAFINEAKSVGLTGADKIRVVGKSSGYHFAGTYSFIPNAVRCGYRDD